MHADVTPDHYRLPFKSFSHDTLATFHALHRCTVPLVRPTSYAVL